MVSAQSLPKLPSVSLELRGKGQILHAILNTPKTYNSFDDQRYQDLIDALNWAETSKDVKAVVLSATGKFFSSGAALSQERLDAVMSGKLQNNGISASMAEKYIDALIDFPKLLVCAIQGPAYGITVTTLPFFDLIYCAPEATFTTPFSVLGICLEGCSSVTFPAVLGPSLTTRLLYLAETVSLKDVLSHASGFVTAVLPAEGIQEEVLSQLEARLEGLSYQSILASKGLVKSESVRKMLHDTNRREMAVLAERVKSEDHRMALTRFQERRKNKKAAGAKL